MKILYAIQGTGNGHVSRARDIIPVLQEKGEVDILISGIQADVDLPYPVKYRFRGFGYVFGKKGGIDITATYKKNNVKQFWKEIKSVPVEEYDIVINDFEPVSAWACYLKNKPCVGLSHQASMLSKKTPKPKQKDIVGATVLKYYAPVTVNYGFHFKAYDKNIYTPVIREQIRSLQVADKGHYTVYLPAYEDRRLLKVLSLFTNVQWQVFSKHNKQPVTFRNIQICPVNNEAFIQSVAGARGVLCGAGFETPAEVMFLKKKLLVIPMKGQYEQQCNAAALKEMGVPVIKSLKKKHAEKIQQWLDDEKVIPVSYPDITAEIIDHLLEEYPEKTANVPRPGKPIDSPKQLRKFTFKKILSQLAG
jgi:uncharacterized protein (TIGR00661 family)